MKNKRFHSSTVRAGVSKTSDAGSNPAGGTKYPRVYNASDDNIPVTAVLVDRTTPYGNPYRVGIDGTRMECIQMFCEEVLPNLDVSSLKGLDLICHCKPKPCHADYILEKANSGSIEFE